jgi:hypothetical protein
MSRPRELEAERRRALAEAIEAGVCPVCGAEIPRGSGVGSGAAADGLFCGVSCYASSSIDTIRLRVQGPRARGGIDQ